MDIHGLRFAHVPPMGDSIVVPQVQMLLFVSSLIKQAKQFDYNISPQHVVPSPQYPPLPPFPTLSSHSPPLYICIALISSPINSFPFLSQRGLTALHDACTEGHTRLALLLLSMGASVKTITKDGWSCLMCACSNGHLQLASILIAIGCEMNAATSVSFMFEIYRLSPVH